MGCCSWFLDGIRHWTGADRRQRSSSNRLGGKHRFDDWQNFLDHRFGYTVMSNSGPAVVKFADETIIRGEVPVKFSDISSGMCTVPGIAFPQAITNTKLFQMCWGKLTGYLDS
jgi:hypothetical protein